MLRDKCQTLWSKKSAQRLELIYGWGTRTGGTRPRSGRKCAARWDSQGDDVAWQDNEVGGAAAQPRANRKHVLRRDGEGMRAARGTAPLAENAPRLLRSGALRLSRAPCDGTARGEQRRDGTLARRHRATERRAGRSGATGRGATGRRAERRSATGGRGGGHTCH